MAVSLNITAHKAWSRFNHARGDTGEAESDIFESAMLEPKSLCYDDVAIQIVDVSKSTLLRDNATEPIHDFLHR